MAYRGRSLLLCYVVTVLVSVAVAARLEEGSQPLQPESGRFSEFLETGEKRLGDVVKGALSWLPNMKTNTESNKFPTCQPSQVWRELTLENGVEDTLRSKYKIYLDTYYAGLAMNSLSIDLVDASFMIRNRGDRSYSFLTSRKSPGEEWPPPMPLSCEEFPYAKVHVTLENGVVAFKGGAPVVGVPDQVEFKKVTLEVRLGYTAFAEYDDEASRKAGRTVFRLPDFPMDDSRNRYNFCLDEFRLGDDLDISTPLVHLAAPRVLEYFKGTIAKSLGKTIKCGLMLKQMPMVGIIPSTTDSEKYWFGVELHSKGSTGENVDLDGMINMKIPTGAFVVSGFEGARSALEALAEHSADLDVIEIERKLNNQVKLREGEVMSFVKSAANRYIESSGYDLKTLHSGLEYLARRYEDTQTSVNIALQGLQVYAVNPRGDGEHAKIHANAPNVLVDFRGGQGYVPLELYMKRVYLNRKYDDVRKKCTQGLFLGAEDPDVMNSLLEGCINRGLKSITPMSLDEVQELMGSEDTEMSGNLHVQISQWHYKSKLGRKFFKAFKDAYCDLHDSSCKETVRLLSEYINENVMSLNLHTGEMRGTREGISVDKENFVFNAGVQFIGPLPLRQMMAMWSNSKQYLLDRIKLLHERRRASMDSDQDSFGSSSPTWSHRNSGLETDQDVDVYDDETLRKLAGGDD